MRNAFIFFDVLFRFAAIGMIYGMYRIAKDAWHTFTHLDDYEYDDWDYDDDDISWSEDEYDTVRYLTRKEK